MSYSKSFRVLDFSMLPVYVEFIRLKYFPYPDTKLNINPLSTELHLQYITQLH